MFRMLQIRESTNCGCLELKKRQGSFNRDFFHPVNIITRTVHFCIRSSDKFLSFYKEIMDAQHFPFYIILSNYV